MVTCHDQRFDHHLVDLNEMNRLGNLAANIFFPALSSHDLKLLMGGFSNANFFVENRFGRYVIRVHSSGASIALREKVLLSTILPKHEIIAPKWLDMCLIDGVTSISLVEFCEGEALVKGLQDGKTSRDALFNVGQSLAHIHSIKFECTGLINEQGTVKAGQWNFLEPWPKFFRSALNGRAGTRMGARRLATLIETVETHWPQIVAALTGPVLVHGDYNPKNILLAGERPIVLDWEFAHSGHFLTDLGNLFRFDEWGEDQSQIIVAGYESEYGPLPENWRDLSRVLDLYSMVEFLDRSRELPKTFQTALEIMDNTFLQLNRGENLR